MVRRLAVPLLAAACALLALPAAAHAGYDLTIDAAAGSSGVTIAVPSGVGGTVVLTPTAENARVGASVLSGHLATRDVQVAKVTAGAQDGDVRVAAALSGSQDLEFLNPGDVRLDADVTVPNLYAVNGGAVVVNRPTLGVSSTLSLQTDLILEQDLRFTGSSVVIVKGAVTGPHTFDASGVGTLQIQGDLGSSATPLERVSFPGGTFLGAFGETRTVWATGDVTVAGDLQLGGSVALRSTAGAVSVSGRAYDLNDAARWDLTLQAATTATVPAATTEPPRNLSVTAPQIALGGSVTTEQNQTYAGRVTASADRTLTGTAIRFDGGLTIAPSRTVRAVGSAGGRLAGTLLGDATSTLRIEGGGGFRLNGGAGSGAVALQLASAGRVDVDGRHDGSTATLSSGVVGGSGALGALTTAAGTATTVDPGGLNGSTPVRGELQVGTLQLSAATTLRLHGVAGDDPFDVLRVAGDAALGGASLDLPIASGTFVDAGVTVPLVDVGGAVSGALAGIADGGTVTVGGWPLTYALGPHGATLRRARLTAHAGLFAPGGRSVVGTPVTFTVVVAPISATGDVTFRDGDTVLGTVALDEGVARLEVGTLALGAHAITASYAGDSRVVPVVANTLSHEVVAAPPGKGDDGGSGGGNGSTGGGGDTGGGPSGGGGPGGGGGGAPGGGGGTAGPRGGSGGAGTADDDAARDRAALATALRRVSAVTARKGTLRFQQRLPQTGRVRWRLTIAGRSTVLVTRTAKVNKAGTTTVTLKLSAKARDVVRRAPTKAKLTLRTELRPASGAPVTVTTTIARPRGL